MATAYISIPSFLGLRNISLPLPVEFLYVCGCVLSDFISFWFISRTDVLVVCSQFYLLGKCQTPSQSSYNIPRPCQVRALTSLPS